jgi:hypothetical protein
MFAEKRRAAAIADRLITFIVSENNRDDDVSIISRTKTSSGTK